MIFIIQTQEELDFYMEQLIEAYLMLFSEEPFSRKDTTREHAITFFNDTFKEGFIYLLTKKDKSSIFGYRTVIHTKYVSDFKDLELVENSFYLSGIWIDKSIRGKGLGSELMHFSLKNLKEMHKPDKIYVRTPINTPEIHHVLHKSGFDIIEEVKAKLNGIEMDLYLWGKYLCLDMRNCS